MKRKLLCLAFIGVLLIFATTVTGCKDKELPTKTITINYYLDNEIISNKTKSYEIKSFVVIPKSDIAIINIPYEDARVFSHWSTTKNGPAFDFNTEIYENLNLYAVCEEADYVASGTWRKNQTKINCLNGLYDTHIYDGHDSGVNIDYPTSGYVDSTVYLKIAKSEILNEYLTKEEWEQYNPYLTCFITDGNGIIKESDVTTNTYSINYGLIYQGIFNEGMYMSWWCYQSCLPKNTKPFENVSSVNAGEISLEVLLKYVYVHSEIAKSCLDRNASIVDLEYSIDTSNNYMYFSDNSEELHDIAIDEYAQLLNTNLDLYNFNSLQGLYCLVEPTYVKLTIKDNNVEHYYALDKNGKFKMDITKAEYDSIK